MGKLNSMRVSDGFRSYALDQLSSVQGLRAKPMFGGYGLYAGEAFFGILAADVLYFKVDDSNRPDYENANAPAFKPFVDRPMSMSYFAVPVSVLEASQTLAIWAARAVAVARTGKPRSKSSSTKSVPSKKKK
jgi:DNA transformation protein and related proteins